jgi:hypothetical protein
VRAACGWQLAAGGWRLKTEDYLCLLFHSIRNQPIAISLQIARRFLSVVGQIGTMNAGAALLVNRVCERMSQMGLRAVNALGLILFLFSALCSVSLRADADADAVQRLLDVGWRPSASNNSQIDQFYGDLPASSHVDYAYALAKLRQYRYDDALAITEPLVDDPTHGLFARRMRIWLLTIRKKHSDALVEMERLAQRDRIVARTIPCHRQCECDAARRETPPPCRGARRVRR